MMKKLDGVNVVQISFFNESECKEIIKYADEKEEYFLSTTNTAQSSDIYNKNQVTTANFASYSFFKDNPKYIDRLLRYLKKALPWLTYPIALQSWVNIYKPGEGIGWHNHSGLDEHSYTANIFLGGIATLVITHSLKRGIGKLRPDGSSTHSFSSGHTATAFLGGTILYHEYKESNMLYASSGYLFSTTAAGLRVANNRHWVSDVLAGAGIGILVANLIYHFEPLKNWNPFKNTKNITFSPIITNDKVTFTAGLTF